MDAARIVGPPDYRVVKGWYQAGADLEQDILPTIRRVREAAGKAPGSLKYFEPAIREKLARDQAEIEHLRKVAARNAPAETRQ